jgi:hypothetical protein
LEIEALSWHRANEAKLLRHGIGREEVDDMVDRGEWVVTVHDDYPDQVRVIGPSLRGRFLTVAMEPTADPRVWRPVTGWVSNRSEEAYYREEYR